MRRKVIKRLAARKPKRARGKSKLSLKSLRRAMADHKQLFRRWVARQRAAVLARFELEAISAQHEWSRIPMRWGPSELRWLAR